MVFPLSSNNNEVNGHDTLPPLDQKIAFKLGYIQELHEVEPLLEGKLPTAGDPVIPLTQIMMKSKLIQKGADQNLIALFEKTFEQAFNIVQKFAPAENNLFSWNEDKEHLKNKEVMLVYTLTDDENFARLFKGQSLPENMDACTVTIVKPDDPKVALAMVGLFIDPIFLDGNEIRPGFLARATVAMAHELYGNVQILLDKKPEGTFPDRKTGEIRAFTAGIEFLDRLIASPFYESLRPAMQESFKGALAHEKAGLKSWQEQ